MRRGGSRSLATASDRTAAASSILLPLAPLTPGCSLAIVRSTAATLVAAPFFASFLGRGRTRYRVLPLAPVPIRHVRPRHAWAAEAVQLA